MELNPVSVTATMQPVSVRQTGRNVLVIRGSQVQNLPVNSIDELLRYLPGIEVQARGPMGAQSDFVLRGGTFQQVLVILDGLRINDPVTGHFNSYIPVAPAEIDRIEVLKGASSAIYGTEAVGGVIHIITKSFAARPQREKALGAQAIYGQYGLYNINAGFYHNNGKTAIGGGLLSNNAQGQPQRGTKGEFSLNTLSFSLSHRLGKNWQLALRSAYDHRHFSAQNFYTTFLSDTAKEKVKTLWNQARIAYTKDNSRFNFQVGFKSTEDNYAYNAVSVPNLNRSRLAQALATYQKQWKATVLTTGVQVQNRTIRSNDRGNHAVAQAAAFVLADQQVGEKLHLNPALRYDWNGRSGGEIVPQINISYALNRFQLRGSAGKTIREADFTERFNNYNKAVVTSGRIGNPDLVAERSVSFEAGADYFLKQVLKLSATYFRRDQKEMIDYVPTAYADMPRQQNLVATGSYALARNIASVQTDGLELDLQFLKNFNSAYSLRTGAGLVWLGSGSSSTTPSFYISSHARFLGNFNVVLQAPRWMVSTTGLYKVRNAQEAAAINAKVTTDYFVLNGKAEVFFWQRKLAAVLQADNIFNRSYSDLLGAQMPGRWLMGGLKLSL